MAEDADAYVPNIVPDMWCTILYNGVGLDKYGNFTVPALARISKLREVCSDSRDGAALMETPYDAKIDYQEDDLKAVPSAFSGGMHFGPGSGNGKRMALSIIRDKGNGQMFAVTRAGLFHKSNVPYCYVDRIHSLGRLAELLNGHSPDWTARLPDLHEMSYCISLTPFHAYPVKGKPPTLSKLEGMKGIVTKNQLVAKEGKGSPGMVAKHYDDFISHRCCKEATFWNGLGPRPRPRYLRQLELVLVSHDDGEPTRVRMIEYRTAFVGKIGTALSRYEFHRPAHPQHPQLAADRVHVLSKALGWDCAPHIVEALGGMTSLLSHGVGPPLPTALDDAGLAYHSNSVETVQERMAEMADAARERREHEEAERTHFQAQMEKFSPGAPKKRERRGAATAAERAIAEASMHAVNVDGSVKKHFRLRCSRKERESERYTENKHLKRAQKKAGGSEEWHRLGEEARDLDFEPTRPRKRAAKSPPAAAGSSTAGAPSPATAALSAFLATL